MTTSLPKRDITVAELRDYLEKSMPDPGKVSGPAADELRIKLPYFLAFANMLPSDLKVPIPYTAPPDQAEPPEGASSSGQSSQEPTTDGTYMMAVAWPPKRWP